jgi:hypothetical protein
MTYLILTLAGTYIHSHLCCCDLGFQLYGPVLWQTQYHNGDFPLCILVPVILNHWPSVSCSDYCLWTPGSHYRLVDSRGKQIADADSIEVAARLLANGAVIAIQGISGTHIATKTSDHRPIETLRLRKKRSQRPFAIMVRDLTTLKHLAPISELEEKILTSWRRPIVLVSKVRHRNMVMYYK